MRVTLLAATAALLITGTPTLAQGVAGTWDIKYTMETPRGSMERTLVVHLTQDGTSLTGNAEILMMGPPGGGGGGGETREVEISEGSVDGANFNFTLTFGGAQRTFAITYAGTVDGDTMTGKVTSPRGGDTPFTGTRGT